MIIQQWEALCQWCNENDRSTNGIINELVNNFLNAQALNDYYDECRANVMETR